MYQSFRDPAYNQMGFTEDKNMTVELRSEKSGELTEKEKDGSSIYRLP